MPLFTQTSNPCPFGFFNSDPGFISEADKMVLFVKRSLGDDILSVELSSKQIWSCFEQSILIYSRYIDELRTKNELINVMGLPTGSIDLTGHYPRRTFEFFSRMSEPYSTVAGIGGSFNVIEGYFTLEPGRQDYDLYQELRIFSGSMSGSLVVDSIPSGSKGKLTVLEVMHFEPLAAQGYLLNSSNINQFMADNFNYESFNNAAAFYVYPVFEDVLRRQMLETSFRVRRSNYSYRIVGSKLRIYPIPTALYEPQQNLFVRVMPNQNPLSSDPNDPGGIAYEDDTVDGISDPSNIPFSIIPYSNITEPGRQWIRQYCLALCKELLGLIRSKMNTIPVPNGELTLNGPELVQQAREDITALRDQLLEFLGELTYDKILEREASIAENLQKTLKYMPPPLGKSILIG
jgi:hypothetical protein